MSPQSHFRPGASGDARPGYRATPASHRRAEGTGLDYQHGAKDKQRTLERFRLRNLERAWRQERYEKGREAWSDLGNRQLPIQRKKHEIMQMLSANRISLLAGETGSGKSTQLAQYALEMGYDRVVYLQPRRVTTDNIADRIEYELREQFAAKGIEYPESLVGAMHSERSTATPDSIVQVMTSAVYKKRAAELEEEWGGEKVLIVADEVHEANIETEFAIATAAEQMERQLGWNMVLMSATLNEDEIQDAYSGLNGSAIPSVTVEGRPHYIEQHERADQTVVEIFAEECLPDGHRTLIFTDGKRSLNAIRDELERQHGESVEVLLLHSKVDTASRQRIFYEQPTPGVHQVIVSTSAGQSGITIPGVDRVISDGWTKSPELDDENASGLPRRLCSRAELTQQMGRGGRDVGGGKFFLAKAHPYKKRPGALEDEFAPFASAERMDHIPADIYHTVITNNVLSAAAMDKDFYRLNEYLIHKVTYDTIEEAYTVLQLIGATDEHNDVTEIGRRMDRLPVRPELARAIVDSLEYDVQTQMQTIAIAAGIESGGLASFSNYKQSHDRLSTHTDDDFISQLDLFLAARRHLNQGETDETKIERDGIDAIDSIRAHKQFHKMCARLEIDEEVRQDLTNTMTAAQRRRLRGLFLSGMPHLLYEEVSRKKRRGRQRKDPITKQKQPQAEDVAYRNILAPPKDKPYHLDRALGRSSVLAEFPPPKGSYVAGYPRWFEDDNGTRYNVVQDGFPVSRALIREVLGTRALHVGETVRVKRNGRLERIRTGKIGRMATYKIEKAATADTADVADQLADEALDKPGSAQRELRGILRQVENYAARVPLQYQTYYFERAFDHTALKKIVRDAAERVGSTGQLDARIREMGLTLDSFVTEDNRVKIDQNYPSHVTLGDDTYEIRYQVGEQWQPYIIVDAGTVFPAVEVNRAEKLAGGRELLARVRHDSSQLRPLSEFVGE